MDPFVILLIGWYLKHQSEAAQKIACTVIDYKLVSKVAYPGGGAEPLPQARAAKHIIVAK